MSDFFDTMYYWTNGLYGTNLDNYLFDDTSGYLHIGLVMLVSSILLSWFYYYVLKPARRQMFWWGLVFVVDAIINFGFTLWYTWSPIINNQIRAQEEWFFLDCVFMGISDVLWAFIFYSVTALIIKWGSPCKYVPYKKF